jgi:prepilin peptidase CpaA
MTTTDLSVGAVVLIACVTDLRSGRIPNVLTFGAALAGVGYAVAASGVSGLAMGLAGWLVGLALFFPIFLLRGMGAGDVKLLAALGAWLGPRDVSWVALYGSVAGGLLAVGLALLHGYGRTLFGNVGLLLTHWRVNGLRSLDTITLEGSRGPRLAYALPIAVGVVCARWLK